MIPAGGCNHEMILEDPPELEEEAVRSRAGDSEDKDTFHGIG